MKTMLNRKIILRTSIIFLAIFTLFCTGLVSIRLYVDQFIKDNYQRRVAVWQETAKNIPQDCIIFIGDSHTEYFMLDEYFPGLPVINRGIYGDTTYGVLNRLDKSVFNLKPKIVFLLIGVNDTKKTKGGNEKIVENIKDIVLQLRNVFPESKIYVQSLYPVNQGSFDAYKICNKRILDINVLLQSFCLNENIAYIDMFSQLVDETGRLREDFTFDGLHLNSAGYRFVADILYPYLW